MTPAIRDANGKEHAAQTNDDRTENNTTGEQDTPPALPAFSPPRMRGYRHVRHLTHHQVADTIGTTPETIEQIETGERVPEPVIVAALATLLGCAYGDLTTTGDPFDNSNYWEAACAALPPLSERAVNSIAATLDRIDARNAKRSTA